VRQRDRGGILTRSLVGKGFVLSYKRPKVLLYVQDSWGLGHIRRVSKLARALERDAHCLILCGHREAGWIISQGCEYIRIPSFNVPLSKGVGGVFWGPRSHFELSIEEAVKLRRQLITSALDAFAPDVLIIENRPLGMSDELDGILEHSSAAKFFLTRGIMTNPSRVGRSYLSEVQRHALKTTFDGILVAVDRRVWDVAAEYDLDPQIANKLEYVGYLSEPIAAAQIKQLRAERGIRNGERWVVCSAGGGALGEHLIDEFTRIAGGLQDVVIDTIQGPHSTSTWSASLTSTIEKPWGRFHSENRSLPLLHAAADLVICPGGSSLLEVMEGGATIITIPVQPDKDDEQALSSSRLAGFYPITVLESYSDLEQTTKKVLGNLPPKLSIRETGALNVDGLQRARELILSAASKGLRL